MLSSSRYIQAMNLSSDAIGNAKAKIAGTDPDIVCLSNSSSHLLIRNKKHHVNDSQKDSEVIEIDEF